MSSHLCCLSHRAAQARHIHRVEYIHVHTPTYVSEPGSRMLMEGREEGGEERRGEQRREEENRGEQRRGDACIGASDWA